MRKNSKIKEGIFPKLTLFNTTDISSKKSRHGLRSIGIVRNASERASILGTTRLRTFIQRDKI